jgi:transposase
MPRRPGSHPGAAGHPRAGGHIPDPGRLGSARAGHQRSRRYPGTLRTLPLGQLLQTCAGLRDSSRRSVEESATVLALRSTARRALACEQEAAELEAQLDRLIRRLAPALLDQLGIGPVVAGQVITSWSHHGRIRSEAAFAKLGGVAPIEASSGTVTRHRLNRSGDRQLNRALHTIVLVRMRQDSATKDYVQRRLAQGKTIRDIKRCLKRYIARQLFRQLEALSSTT